MLLAFLDVSLVFDAVCLVALSLCGFGKLTQARLVVSELDV